MKRCYLAGPMTGIAEDNYPSFRIAAKDLRDRGYIVFSPAEIHDSEPGVSWESYMKRDFMLILQYCEFIAVMPGWERSRGARSEVFLATLLKIPVVRIQDLPNQGIGFAASMVDQEHFDFLCNLVMTDPKSLGRQPAQPEATASEKDNRHVVTCSGLVPGCSCVNEPG